MKKNEKEMEYTLWMKIVCARDEMRKAYDALYDSDCEEDTAAYYALHENYKAAVSVFSAICILVMDLGFFYLLQVDDPSNSMED